MQRSVSIIVLLLGLSTQLTSSDLPKHVPSGTWGGPHLSMTVNSDGADLEFDCATGSIPSPLIVDRKGGFRLKGTYRHQSPAQTRADDVAGGNDGMDVLYIGKLNGNSLSIAVTLPGMDKPTVFHLIRNHEGVLTRCA